MTNATIVASMIARPSEFIFDVICFFDVNLKTVFFFNICVLFDEREKKNVFFTSTFFPFYMNFFFVNI